MMSLSDVPFGFLIFSSNMSKTKRPSKQQRGSTIHPCLIALICHCANVPFYKDDVCSRSTKELDKGLMNLSNVMSAVAHGDPHPLILQMHLRKKDCPP